MEDGIEVHRMQEANQAARHQGASQEGKQQKRSESMNGGGGREGWNSVIPSF